MGNGTRARRRVASAAVIGVLTAGGLTVAAGGAGAAGAARTAADGTSGGGGGKPACTRTALQSGLTRGAAPVKHAHVVKPFGCSGRWAYAAVETKRFEATALLRIVDNRWATVDRGKPCTDGAVPKAIRKPACNSN